MQALIDAGHPLIRVRFRDRYDLGSQFFLWEFATAIAGARLGIHPFDQPDVESAKQQSRLMMTAYMEQGSLPEPSSSMEVDGVQVYLDSPNASPPGTPADALKTFLQRGGAGDYISIQAYLQPCPAIERQLRSYAEPVAQADGTGNDSWGLAPVSFTLPASCTKGIAATVYSSSSPTGPPPMPTFPTSPACQRRRCRSAS